MTTDEFIAAHGGCPVEDAPGVLLLPDGAQVRCGQSPTSTLMDPPAGDPRQLYRRRVRYAQLQHDAAAKAVKHFWAVCSGCAAERFAWDRQALGPPPPEWDQLLQLGAGRGRHWELEAAVKAHLSNLLVERRQALDAVTAEAAATPVYQPL